VIDEQQAVVHHAVLVRDDRIDLESFEAVTRNDLDAAARREEDE